MKINRLLEIALLLINKGKTTAGDLAEKFDVSTRTIYRDIDILSTAGIPVYTTKGTGGGIFLMEDYSLNKAVLSNDERESLLLALKSLQVTKYPEIDSTLEKLSSLFKSSLKMEWVDIDYNPWGSGPNAENKLLKIKQAILENTLVEFDYLNASGIRTHRTVEPMQLRFKSQAWYLNGFCRLRDEVRMFRLSRMKNLEITGKHFIRRELDTNTSQRVENETAQTHTVTLKLRFQPEDLFRVFDDYEEEDITRNEDGTYDVTVTFPEDEWVYGYILSFGHYVEVLDPPHVRKIVAARMRKAMKYYRNS
ncbi:MAG: YafY family transcriptional regulator [Dehalococcoidales bacterium]|nr:YafY family transcriptional regulator [Dehalococcoidales bacterium]